MRLKEELQKFKETDMYSLILFTLFKIKDIPEYSTLSELVYILDKDSLLKLCEYYGGLTIKIPTIEDLEGLVYSLVLYEAVDIKQQSFDEALKEIQQKYFDIKKVKSNYYAVKEVLAEYAFKQE